MKRYVATFNGRTVGAIGIRYRCHIEVEAEDAKAAGLKLYETHEHISDVRITEVRTPVDETNPMPVSSCCRRGFTAPRGMKPICSNCGKYCQPVTP